LDNKNFQPNVFTTATRGANGAIRIVVEPKPGVPPTRANVNAAIDTFTSDALVAVGIPTEHNPGRTLRPHQLTIHAVA
jgi:hypothetical protein